jgi:hypothetical protein
MFLVRRDLLDGACPPPFASFAKKNYRMVHFCVTQPERQDLWVELKTYLRFVVDFYTEMHENFEFNHCHICYKLIQYWRFTACSICSKGANAFAFESWRRLRVITRMYGVYF